MERPAQLVYEGSRTFEELNVTIEIVIIHLFKFGLFEVLTRDQDSQCELRPVYLRSCIIEQRVKPNDVDALIISSRSKFDPNGSLNDDELFDVVVRASIFDYISYRLSLRKKTASFSGMYYEVYYSPAIFDLEACPDRRHLDQLVCSDPYYFGPPPPCQEISPTESSFSKLKDLQNGCTKAGKPSASSAPTKFGSVLRRFSAFFAPLISTHSERSLQTESALTACSSLSQASGDAYSIHGDSHQPKAAADKQNANQAPTQQELANRIMNRLKKLPDISEGPSGNLASEGHNLAARADPSSFLSPPKCISNAMECSNDSPFSGPEFYDDSASGNIHAKPVPVLNLDAVASEDAAAQLLGGALHRSARVGIA